MQQNDKQQIIDVVRPTKKAMQQASNNPARLVLNKISGLRLSQKKWAFIFIVCAIVGTSMYVLAKDRQKNQLRNDKSATSQTQIDIITEKVGKLMLLPSGEQPTMAIINDTSQFKDIAFFKNSVNGDRALVYAQARIAILYRPSINKIISVAPLSSSGSSQTPSSNQ